MMNITTRRSTLLILGLAALFSGYSFFFFNYNVEDAAIYWRVSRNIVDHAIYSYNYAGLPFDPTSGIAYVLLGVIPEALGIDTRIFFKIIGVVVLFMFTFRSIRHASAKNDDLWKYLPAFVLLATPYTFIHTYSGLETLLFSFLIFELGVVGASLMTEESVDSFRGFSIVALLLAITRWEGMAIAGLSFLLFWVSLRSKRKEFFRSFLLYFSFPIGALVVARWVYFGDPLPTSYYFKSSAMSLGERLHNLFWYHFERIEWILLLLSLLIFLWIQQYRPRSVLVWLALIVGCITVFYSQSKLFMDFADRFAFGLVLPLLVFFSSSINWKIVPAKVAILPLLFILWIPHHQKQRTELKELASAFGHQCFLNSIGMLMHPYANTGAVVALDIAGAIPYYSGWEAIDYYGLCDPVLAKFRGKDVSVPPEMLDNRRIDLLVLNPGSLDSSSFNYAMLRRVVERLPWEFVGSSEGLALYLNSENTSLASLKTRLTQLIEVSKTTPTGLKASFGFCSKPQGSRFDRYLAAWGLQESRP